MNKDRPTENRIGWTTEALNAFLPIYNDIEELQITRRHTTVDNNRDTLSNKTERDIDKLHQFIVQRLLSTYASQFRWRVWNGRFLYPEGDDDESTRYPIPSNKLEAAFSKVGDLYLKHQYVWDNALPVVPVNTPETDEMDTDDESDENNESDAELEIDQL
jgi:hypothetical protein